VSPAEARRSIPIAFHRGTPILRVSDLEASLNYYIGVLGFRLDWRDDDGNSFASVSRDHCQFFLSVGDQGNPGSWMCIVVSDVDALHEELLAKGARVRHPPTNYPWGLRELHIEDPDGNVLRLGSQNKPGEPLGDWLDMRGVLWRRGLEGGWTRAGDTRITEPSGIWGLGGLPFLDLTFDGVQVVSGTTYWRTGGRSVRAAIKQGAFDVRTNALRLEGDTASLDGEGDSHYVIEGSLANETLNGTYDCGGLKGTFIFTRIAARKG
jgi:catechol 2,3-dioxygenase-like lactoylglutathione lyase family enzyme